MADIVPETPLDAALRLARHNQHGPVGTKVLADEIDRLRASPGGTMPPRLLTLLRESMPLRLALVEAMHDRALRTLRLAAEDPSSADTLLADLLAASPG